MRKNVGMDTATAVATSTASPDTTKKKKQEILKITAIKEKLQLHTTSYWTKQGTSIITF